MTALTDSRLTRDPELLGRAVAITVLGIFAVIWLGWGTGTDLSTAAETALMIVATLGSATLAALAWRRWRRSTAVAAPSGSDVRRRFRRIVTVEGVVLIAAAIALNRTGHQHQVAAVVCAGVGLHFLPLARLFHAPVYDATALAMCLLAIAAFVLAPTHPTLWITLPGIGAAASLYATCVVVLLNGRHGARPTADERPDRAPAMP
jgi:hypothetical protein